MMKKSLLSKLMLLLALVVMGVGSASAETSTLTFTAACGGSGTANDGAVWAVTSDGEESNYDSTAGIHYGTNKSATVQYVQLSTSDIPGTISQVVVNTRDAQAKATVSVTVGGVAFTCSGSSTATNSPTDYTFTGSGSGAIVVRVDRGSSEYKAIYVKSIAVTYATSSLSSISVSGQKTSFYVGDEFSFGGTLTAHYSDESSSEVNIASATFSGYDMDDTESNPQTVTVSYGGKTTTYEITVSEKPKYSITWMSNGSSVKSADITMGESLISEFPDDPAAVNGKVFMGWTESATVSTSGDGISYVNKAEATATEAKTYYAVFAKKTTGDVNPLNITTSTDNIPTSYGNANTFSQYTLDGKKFKVQQMYLNSEKLQWRASGNGNGTGTMYNVDALDNIISIVLTYSDSDNNKNFTVRVGDSENPTSGTSITPTISSNVYTFDCSGEKCGYFVLTNGANAGYLTSIAITYGTPDTYFAYTTTPSSENVEISAAGYATLYATTPLDFSEVAGLTAYTATVNGANVELTKVNNVQAETGVIVAGNEGTYSIPVAVSSSTAKGDLKVAATAITQADAEETIYVLNKVDDEVGFFQLAADGTLAAGKAYLDITAVAGARLTFTFADDITGIRTISNERLTTGEAIYNLQGQKIANGKSLRGLFIKNGKKVIVK